MFCLIICSDHLKTGQKSVQKVKCLDFKCFFGKMTAICPDFKWLCFQILDPIQNLDHLQTNLFWDIQNQDLSGFQMPTLILY